MSLVVGLNLDDYVILAADKRGFIGYRDEVQDIPLFKSDTCNKLRKLPFGYFAAAGDYLVTECFYTEAKRITNIPRDLQDILIDTYNRHYNTQGICHFSQKTSIILILRAKSQSGEYNCDRDLFLEIGIDANNIGIKEIEPMSFAGYMAIMNPDKLFWGKIAKVLREIHTFEKEQDFFNYHLNLVRYIWEEQLRFDENISHHIDFYIHNRITGKGLLFGAEEVNFITKESAEALAAMPLFDLRDTKA